MLRRYVWGHVAWYLYDQLVTAIFDGILTSIQEMKAKWKLGTEYLKN